MTDIDTFASGDAQILDRGFRRYDGPRHGMKASVVAVIKASVQRAMGVRRSLWAKLLPLASAAFAFVPAIVFVGIVALVDFDELDPGFLPSYGEYYGFIIAALALFSALVAPEVLCTDRRTGMLGVYFASPLTRNWYLVAKAAAIAFVLAIVCLGPTLLMLIANVLQNQGPEGAGDITLTLARVLAAGVVITLMHTGLTMGIASLTDRKTIAFAAVVMFLLMTWLTAGVLSAGQGLNAGGIRAISPWFLTLEVAARVHGERGVAMRDASTAIVWGAWFGWTALGFFVTWFQMRRLAVTR